MTINFEAFMQQPFYDEMVTPKGNARAYARKLFNFLNKMSSDELDDRQQGADLAIKQMGITFRVYSKDGDAIDRAWPFDIIPRLIPRKEWNEVEKGLKQRVQALNLFIDDLYHDQKTYESNWQ